MAVLLTMIFVSNIVVGFACTIGSDLIPSGEHHHEHLAVSTIKGHTHPKGTKSHSHQHESAKSPSAHTHDEKQQGKKENCCKDEVAKFVAVTKRQQNIL